MKKVIVLTICLSTLPFPSHAEDPRLPTIQSAFEQFIVNIRNVFFFRLSNEYSMRFHSEKCREFVKYGKPRFQVCVERKRNGQTLSETLSYIADNKPAGVFKLTRKGTKITETPFNKLVFFDWPIPGQQGENFYKLSLPALQAAFVYKKAPGSQKEVYYLNRFYYDYTLKLTHDPKNKQYIYQMPSRNCNHCPSQNHLIVTATELNFGDGKLLSKYFLEGMEVTPITFLKVANRFIEEHAKFAQIFLASMIHQHQWPNIFNHRQE